MSNFLTVKQFCAEYPAYKIGGVRDKIFHAETNGLLASSAIVRDGGKVLINVERWFARLQPQAQSQNDSSPLKNKSLWTRSETKRRLEAGETLSTFDQCKSDGGWRLAAHIESLKKEGLPILSFRRKGFGKCAFYVLEPSYNKTQLDIFDDAEAAY